MVEWWVKVEVVFHPPLNPFWPSVTWDLVYSHCAFDCRFMRTRTTWVVVDSLTAWRLVTPVPALPVASSTHASPPTNDALFVADYQNNRQ